MESLRESQSSRVVECEMLEVVLWASEIRELEVSEKQGVIERLKFVRVAAGCLSQGEWVVLPLLLPAVIYIT